AFRMHGRTVSADVRFTDEGRLLITRLIHARRGQKHDSDVDRYPVLLAQARFRFCDHTVAGQFRGVAQTQLDQIVRQAGSYLERCRQYNDLEAKTINDLNRSVGAFAYESWDDQHGGQIAFRLKDEPGLEERLDDLLAFADTRGEDRTVLEASETVPE